MREAKDNIQVLSDDMKEAKEKIELLSDDMKEAKDNIQTLTDDMSEVRVEVHELKQEVAGVKLHLENVTDRNIRLLAENFVELTKKLNQAIPIANKNLAYEVKVDYLIERVQTIERDVADIKNKIA